MAQKTLLQICQEAVGDVKDIAVPSTIIGNVSPDAVLLKGMASKVGRELERGFNWQDLKREYVFTTTGVESYPLPADYRRLAPLTTWNRTGALPLVSVNPFGYQSLKSGIIVSGYTYFFEISNSTLNFQPLPPAGLTFAMNYYSSQFIEISAIDSTGIDDWTADTNVCRFDGDLMVLGVLYRYLNRNGAPATEEKGDYLQAIKDLQYDDTPAPIIDTGRAETASPPLAGVPNGGWALS